MKPLPKLPQRFYVRTEIIYEESSIITYEDVCILPDFHLYTLNKEVFGLFFFILIALHIQCCKIIS